ncbi:hypothetical protein GCM10010431_01710 [Streptomyces kunmingensis]
MWPTARGVPVKEKPVTKKLTFPSALTVLAVVTLAMPILAPLADFAGVPRAVVVTAWQAASGWMNLWVPTTAVTIGGVALA